MRGIFIFICAVFFSCSVSGQDTINRTDTQGRKQGFWVKRDSSGQKVYDGRFVDGVPSGNFKYYYPNGTLKTTSFISMSGKRAVTVSYFPNGKKMAAGNYLNEKRDSLWQFFSDVSGLLVSAEFYKAGKLDGKSTVYFPEGAVSEIKHYKAGIPDGGWVQYFSDGKIQLQATFKAGEKDGAFKTFFPSGKTMVSGNYSGGHVDGAWIYYDEKGKILKKELYKVGELLKREIIPTK